LNLKIEVMESMKGKSNELLRRKRKMLLILPAVLIPLLTLGFYAMGGGSEVRRVKALG